METCNRLAARVLSLKGRVADKAWALTYVSNFGGKEHLPMAVGLFADPTVVEKGLPNTPSPDDILLRDVALLTAVKLTGQDPEGYGLEPWKDVEGRFPWAVFGCAKPHPLRFRPTGGAAAGQKRTAAFRKWDAWAAGHLKDGKP